MENIENIVVENEEIMEDVMAEAISATSGKTFDNVVKVGAIALLAVLGYEGTKRIFNKVKRNKEAKEECFDEPIMVDEEDVVEDAVN